MTNYFSKFGQSSDKTSS